MELAVEAKGLVKQFGDRAAIEGIDLRVPKGAIFGFLGQNGAGKTTSLRVLLGILDPDAGIRRILGSERPLSVAARIGYLPEERGLYQSMSARDVIAYLGALRGLSLHQGRRRAEVLLRDQGLGEEIHAPIKTLSKGMAQKVQLLATIVHAPDLIVLDEPFSGLDPVNQQGLEELIRREQARGATILFSTHVMAHAERLCDELVIIAHGRNRFAGTVEMARRRLPSRVTLGLDRPPPADALPPDATFDGQSWRFDLPTTGLEPILRRLLNAQAGIRDLSVEQPSLHDAFVDLVGADEPLGAAA